MQLYDGLKIIQQGGAAMNACWVLEQEPACYFKFPKPEAGGGGGCGILLRQHVYLTKSMQWLVIFIVKLWT